MKSIDELERKVEELVDLLAATKQELASAKKAMSMLTPEQRIAVRLHDLTCRWNHTDGCGWFYEFNNKQHDWNGSAHKAALEKARKLLIRCAGSYERAEEVMNAQAIIGGL